MSIETATTNLMPLLNTIGFGGVFFAVLLYLQSQDILNINCDKLHNTSQGIVSTVAAALTTTAGGSMSIPGISLPTTMTNLGIPLTSGTAAVGFTIGFMKG
jgi:uncharacterized membrane protein (Fun14 family)